MLLIVLNQVWCLLVWSIFRCLVPFYHQTVWIMGGWPAHWEPTLDIAVCLFRDSHHIKFSWVSGCWDPLECEKERNYVGAECGIKAPSHLLVTRSSSSPLEASLPLLPSQTGCLENKSRPTETFWTALKAIISTLPSSVSSVSRQ